MSTTIASVCGECSNNDLVHGVTLPNLTHENRSLDMKKVEFTRAEAQQLDFVGLPVYLNHEDSMPQVGVTIAARYLENERGEARLETLHKLNSEADVGRHDRSTVGTISVVQRNLLMCGGHRGLSLGHRYYTSEVADCGRFDASMSGKRGVRIHKVPFEISICTEGAREGSEITTYLPCRNSIYRSPPKAVASYAKNYGYITPNPELVVRASKNEKGARDEWSAYLDTLWPHVNERRQDLIQQRGFIERLRTLEGGVVCASREKWGEGGGGGKQSGVGGEDLAWQIAADKTTMSETPAAESADTMKVDAKQNESAAKPALKKNTSETVSHNDDEYEQSSMEAAMTNAQAFEAARKSADELKAENEKIRRELEMFRAKEREIAAEKEKAAAEEKAKKDQEVTAERLAAIDAAFEEITNNMSEEEVEKMIATRDRLKTHITPEITQEQLDNIGEMIEVSVLASKSARERVKRETSEMLRRKTKIAHDFLKNQSTNKPSFADDSKPMTSPSPPSTANPAGTVRASSGGIFGRINHSADSTSELVPCEEDTVRASRKRSHNDAIDDTISPDQADWIAKVTTDTVSNFNIIPTYDMLAHGGFVRVGKKSASANGGSGGKESIQTRFQQPLEDLKNKIGMQHLAPELYQKLLTTVRNNFTQVDGRVNQDQIHEVVKLGMERLPKDRTQRGPVHLEPLMSHSAMRFNY